MKPLRIELENFGSYESHAVDLAPFLDEGLFLIHGDTGAGKSTLLDAITWALYGRGLGDRVHDDLLRHSAAGPEAATRVSLTFQVGDRTFRVRREMERQRAAKRGGGVTKQRADAVLECLVGDTSFETVQSISRVNEAVESLLRLPYGQFTRVIVLPQGEFRALLLSPAEEQERLLERIFGTERYQAIEARLRELSTRLAADVTAQSAGLAALLQGAQVDDVAALDATRRALAARRDECVQERDAAREAAAARHDEATVGRRLRARNAERAGLRARLAAMQSEGAAHDASRATAARAERAARCEPARDAVVRARAQAVDALARRDAARAEATRTAAALEDPETLPAALRALESERAGLAAERPTLMARVERVLQWTRSETEVADAEVALARAAPQLAPLDAQLDAESAALAAVDAQRAVIAEALRDEPVAQRRHDEVTRRRQTFEARRGVEDRVRKATMSLRDVERRAKQSARDVDELRAQLDRARELARTRLAATLSATLVDGAPCPVCGAHEHPQPAAPPDDARDDDLDAMARELEAREAARSTAAAQFARAQGELDALQRDLADRRAEDDLDEASLLDLERAARAELDRMRALRQQSSGAERQRKAHLDTLANLTALRDGERARVESLRVAHAAAAARRAQLQADLGGEAATLTELRDALAAHDRRAAETSKRLDALRARRAEAELADARVRGQLEAMERAADEAESRRAQAERDLAVARATEGFSSEAMLDEARLDPAATRALLASLTEFDDAMRAAARELSVLGPDDDAPDDAALAALDDLARAAADAVREAERSIGALDERARALASIDAQAQSRAAELAESSRRAAVTRRVSDVVNGHNEARTRLSRYVLLEQFDRVVACASARLSQMSDGRFHLRRRSVRQMGREFELVVDDAYTGAGERSAATLSGGEMFLASLAMALGLGDVLQAWAGGVRVESLFVDEGFGSLDEDSLDKAVSVLEQLPEHARLVGVVSHVGEMRKRIPARLEVIRTEHGTVTRASVRTVRRDGGG